MADDIKQRVIIEAAEAIHNLEKVSDAEQRMADGVREAGKEAHAASGMMLKLDDAAKGLLATLGTAQVLQAFIKMLTEFSEQMERAHAATAKLSEKTGGLAANLGGKLGGEAVGEVAGIAAESGFSPAGREALTNFVAGMSDLRDLPDKDAVRAIALKGATLQKSTGGGIAGEDAANLMQALGTRFGVDDDAAVNIISTLANSGFGGSEISTMIEKGADKELMGLVMAARGSGLPRADIGRKTQSVLDSVMAVGDDGAVSPELAALGITDAMGSGQRVRHLIEGRNAGTISAGDFNQATGGPGNRVYLDALAAAIKQGKVAPAMAELSDPNAAKTFIDRRMSSPFAQAEVSRNIVALEEEAEEVELGRSEYAEAMAMHAADDVPAALRPFISLFTSDKAVKSAIGRRITNIKGRWGLIPRAAKPGSVLDGMTGDNEEAMLNDLLPGRAAAPPTMDTMKAGALMGAGMDGSLGSTPFRPQEGEWGTDERRVGTVINYINSTIRVNGKDEYSDPKNPKSRAYQE